MIRLLEHRVTVRHSFETLQHVPPSLVCAILPVLKSHASQRASACGDELLSVPLLVNGVQVVALLLEVLWRAQSNPNPTELMPKTKTTPRTTTRKSHDKINFCIPHKTNHLM
jgi:hypothetical protein